MKYILWAMPGTGEQYESQTSQTQRVLIKFADGYEKEDEAWQALNQIVADYSKDGKSVYTPTFIEDNEDKVKALQEQYEFTYEIIEK